MFTRHSDPFPRASLLCLEARTLPHGLDALYAPLPRASLRASCDWACPDCELMCGILARTVRDTGADLAAALAQLPAIPTADLAQEVERLRRMVASARRRLDRKSGLLVDLADLTPTPMRSIESWSLH